jgi:branched-chain amino acid transport system substrate-binding protein
MTLESESGRKSGSRTPSRRTVLKTGSAASLFGLAGCTSLTGGGGGGGGGSTVRVGLTRSTTGDFVFDSRKGFRGLKLWQQRTNDSGGLDVGGEQKEVELVSYDDRSSKQRTTRLYETLCTEDDVDVLFAPFSSTLTSAAAAVANKHDKYIMAWGAASQSIYEQGYNNLMSVETPTSIQPRGFLTKMEEVGAETVALLHLDAAFTTSLADAVKEQIGNFDLELVHAESHGSETSDFTSTLQQIKDKDPDVFWPINYVGSNVTIIRQMKSNGISFPWVQMVYATNPQFYDSLETDAKYWTGQHNIDTGLEKDINLGLTVSEFFTQYRETFGGNQPSFNSANGYSAAIVLGESISQAGTARDTEALIDASLELSGDTTVVNGLFSVHPERHHQDHSNYFAAQNQATGGETIYDNMECIGPEEVAPPTAEPIYPAPSWDER